MNGIDFSLEGFLNGLEAFSKGITTDDLSLLCEIHQKVLEIKNLIQDSLDLDVSYFYSKEDGKYKIEIFISTSARAIKK